MNERYTRREVARILGLEERQLAYWERLRLVRSRARWGERFYAFDDLVALQTIKHLGANRIPAARLRRALQAMEQRLGCLRAPLSALRVWQRGGQVIVIPPAPYHQPFEPLTGQFVLPFQKNERSAKTTAVAARTAQEWFDMGMSTDSRRETLPQAVEAYRRAIELSPGWVEARINLGTAYYQMSDLEEARRAFESALEVDEGSATAHFNLGCVLDDLEEYNKAIQHLRRAAEIAPHHADTYFNLALVLEKRGKTGKAREHWATYLRLQPRGPWADYARARLRTASRPPGTRLTPIPFPETRARAATASQGETPHGSD
ncbi:MAG: tetratricopeptide repeat protein [Acidobacteria bacterium]|nr:tetratricopeptide repeat protein [Acidobacteriota bacterium]MCL5288738.1 tetratricopeptide repeat protein [Acidobacteriota bacterium]